VYPVFDYSRSPPPPGMTIVLVPLGKLLLEEQDASSLSSRLEDDDNEFDRDARRDVLPVVTRGISGARISVVVVPVAPMVGADTLPS
jgi:hypothetical protein